MKKKLTNKNFLFLNIIFLIFYSCEKIPNKNFNNPLDPIEANRIISDSTITNKFGDRLELPALLFYPDTIISSVDDFFSIGIYAFQIDSLDPIVLTDIFIDFDFRKIEVENIIPGDFLDSEISNAFVPNLSDNKKLLANNTGKLQVSAMSFNDGNSGSGKIATIVFKANFSGEIILGFNKSSKFLNTFKTDSNLFFNELDSINIDFFKGTIIVEK